MFGLFTRSSSGRKPANARSIRLNVERLEDRLCLTGGGSEALSMSVTYDAGKQVTLAGTLTNGGSGVNNQTIYFGGVVSGSATTNNQGAYSVTLPVSQLGQVVASSADGLSNTLVYTLVGGSPAITNFKSISLGNGLWEFTGTVTGAPAQGEVVDLGGIPALNGKQVTVNSDGTFIYYTTVASGQGGVVSAYAVDWWGDESTEVYQSVSV